MDPLTPEEFEALRRLETPMVANVIDTFAVRLRNEGFADASIRCLFPLLEPMLGYAVTVRIRCSSPPPTGHAYPDRTDWWNHIISVPSPRVVVIQDVDSHPGRGALLGEVHGHILKALDCVGAATNGSVRDSECFGSHAICGVCRHMSPFPMPMRILCTLAGMWKWAG